VIDYYYDDGSASQDQRPSLTSPNSVKSIYVDVRPAADSMEAIIDRLRKFPERTTEAMERDKRGCRFTVAHQNEVKELNRVEAEKTKQKFEEIQTRCAARFKEVQQCQGDEACEKATLGMNYCMAQVVCKEEASDFIKAMETSTDGRGVQAAYEQMDKCLWKFGLKAGRDLRDLE